MNARAAGRQASPFATALVEALGFCADGLREKIISTALAHAGLSEVPSEPLAFREFVRAAILPLVEDRFECGEGEEVVQFLEPIIQRAMPGPQSRTRVVPVRPVVLIVQVDSPERAALAAFLQGEGYEVCVADSVKRARELVVDRRVSLVLCDLGVPGIAGHYLLPQLRGVLGDEVPPVVEISADPEASGRVPGIAAVLAQPLHPDDLLAAVDAVVGRPTG